MALIGLDVASRTPFADGRAFGSAGVYERIDGVARFALDPGHPANAEIADLALAARGGDGRVAFDADFTILRPVNGGARTFLLDICNRGGKPACVFLNRAERPLAPTPEIDPGDGFQFARGWTLAWVGWQWDVAAHPGLLGLRAPEARIAGAPPPGLARVEVSFSTRQPHCGLRDETLGPSMDQTYTAADADDPDAELFLQDSPDSQRQTLPRARWRFARQEASGAVVRDADFIWLEGGFEPGRYYTVLYRAARCPVVGVGLAAARDFAAHLRRDAPFGAIDRAYAFGVSQSGRFLRTLLHHGMNRDEDGRQVFDGMHIHIAGGRRGEFNTRFAMPAVEGAIGLGHLPPFAETPVRGVAAGLLDRQRALGGVPKIVATNTAAEYWRGDASLSHSDAEGRDAPLAPETRAYLFAGTQHGPGLLPLMTHNPLNGDAGLHPFNIVDYSPLTRAALINLDRWVREGAEPPASQIPNHGAGTAAAREDTAGVFAKIPGAHTLAAKTLRRLRRYDFGADAAQGVARHPPQAGAEYVSFASAVDGDGNETAGLRLPDISSPVATHAGWNPRDPAVGGAGQALRLTGSTLPFARTAAERAARGDPRPAIAERYADRAAYAAAVARDADALIAARHILAEDRTITIAAALARYDAVMAGG
ncbi:MAG: alpha/beta hydrolase domain-containing protein [Hyphomonadaceae bacterium]